MVIGEGEAAQMLKPLVADLKRALGISGGTEEDGFEEAQAEAAGQMREAIQEGEKVEVKE